MARKAAKKEVKTASGVETVAVSTPKAAETVTVCMHSIRDIAFPLASGKRVVVRGCTFELRGKDTGVIDVTKVQQNVIDAKDWEEMQVRFAHNPLFKNGLIYEVHSQADVDAHREELKDVLMAQAPVDPKKTVSKPLA